MATSFSTKLMNLNEYVRQRGLSDNERMKYDFQIIEGVKKRSNI
jgi:hypothetical protein